ncbi:hypothetical protein VTN31DRAFT_3384 [Thermomyces dupontii]|uniref:uncharacterized protein n=1 Tax=Talaromyces thermophilus TaxID=28565 RepID=UPI0037433F82
MTFSPRQFTAIVSAERASSLVSLAGTTFVLSTFFSSQSFRKPINRLVLLATWGNIMANVATLVSRSGIERGERSALCQFQAFLIQWFMPADALWTLCMAFNVYLTFFHQYNSSQLRKLEWKYFLLCYGVPFISAFVFLFVDSHDRGPLYGPAVPWNTFPLVILYGPLWFVILFTFAIHIRAGIEIFQQRNTLRRLHDDIIADLPADYPNQKRASRLIEITTGPEGEIDVDNDPWALEPAHHRDYDPSGIYNNGALQPKSVPNPVLSAGQSSPYSIAVKHDVAFPRRQMNRRQASPTTEPLEPLTKCDTDISAAARAYCKYAMLYFVALVVTWVPSTINRAYGFVHPDKPNFGLSFTSALVLPLQGFWNSLIYTAISWPLIRQLITQHWGRWQQRRRWNKTNTTASSGSWKLLSSAWGFEPIANTRSAGPLAHEALCHVSTRLSRNLVYRYDPETRQVVIYNAATSTATLHPGQFWSNSSASNSPNFVLHPRVRS